MAPRKKASPAAAAAATKVAGASKTKTKQPAAKSPAPRSNLPAAERPAAKRRRIEHEFLVGKLQAGQCFTFGSNPFGALGLGEDVLEKFRAAHVEIEGGKRVVQVACGGMHTVALAEDGSVHTWGVNDEGALGRPSAGSAWDAGGSGGGGGVSIKESAKEDACVPGRARLPADVFVVQVVAGDGFTFALADDGAVWGWGCFKDDASGTAGFLPNTPSAKLARLPVRVYAAPSDGGARDRVRKLAAGARHAAALTRRGEVLTWGMGGQGQLGRIAPYDTASYPPLTELLIPAPVTGLTAALGNAAVVDIAAGAYATFALTARGAVAAWGLNNAGQLGVAPASDDALCAWAPLAPPAPLDGGAAAIAGGEHHSLALTKRGALLAWGAPTYGMLGRADVDAAGAGSARHPEPAPVALDDGLADERVAALAAGTNVSGCVTRGGNAYLWGSNVNGQMAKGADEDDNLAPTRLRRHKTFGNRRIVALSFGGQHGALLALDEDDGAPPTPGGGGGGGGGAA